MRRLKAVTGGYIPCKGLISMFSNSEVLWSAGLIFLEFYVLLQRKTIPFQWILVIFLSLIELGPRSCLRHGRPWLWNDARWDPGFGGGGKYGYPLVNIQKAIEVMAIEVVDLPIKHGGSFHSYGTVYQRVCSTLKNGILWPTITVAPTNCSQM